MRYLRMLSNSLIAGAMSAAYLTVLVLHLNPVVPITAAEVTPLAATMWLAYGINLAVVFYALIVLRQLAATEVLSPGWLSVRLLSWLCTIAAAAGATMMWLNLRGFAPVLDEQTIGRLTAAAFMLSTSAMVFLLIAVAHIGRRGGRVSAALLVVAMVLSIVAPLLARGRGGEATLAARATSPVAGLQTARPEGRIVLLMLDGASLDVITPAVAEGRLPNFGRVFDAGAVLHLATLRPTQAETVWSAAATGRPPMANGIRASARYRARSGAPVLSLLPDYCFAQALVRFGFLIEEPHDSRSLNARPIWQVLSDVALPVAVIGWPLTYPAPNIHGVVVSDAFQGRADTELDFIDSAVVSPPEILPQIIAALGEPTTPDPVTIVAAFGNTPQSDPGPRDDRSPIVADRTHLQILSAVERNTSPRFTAIRFPGVDAVGHYFLRFANPVPFGDVSDEERKRYGRLLDEYYGFVDTIVGRMIDVLKPDDLLLVASPFGMEPLSPGKRLLERFVGNPDISGTHERAPDGFLLAYGAAVAAGRPRRGSVLDVTPTVLYYLGLAVGRDMEGFARTDLFTPDFTASRPITFIPSYGR